jgi:putative tryptophan/tyrosine transport system substrate-binding protein
VDPRSEHRVPGAADDGRRERSPATVAGELVSLCPDLILVQSVPATRALMQATKSIPIVMFGVGNPVEYGIVANHSRPGGNVTGSSYLANEYTGKLLQLLKEAIPRLQRVAFISNPSTKPQLRSSSSCGRTP